MRKDIQAELSKHCRDTLGLAAARLLQVDANVLATGGVALAGGYIRDLYFGHKPKDMDFVFWGLTPNEFLEAFHMWRVRHGQDCDVNLFPDDYDKDGAISTVIKITLPDGTPVDWILYNANSLDEVLEAFDHSINHFVMRFDEEFKLHVEAPAGHGVCTRNPNVTLSQERVERFREMARANDWEYV